MSLQKFTQTHYTELSSSGIDSQILSLNFLSLQGFNVYNYIFISEQIPRNNTGIVSNSWLKRYSPLTFGGWWCSGLDPQNHWQTMDWGCFKPDQPRVNTEGKIIKYEHPPGTATRVFCLRITMKIWRKIADRYGIEMPINVIDDDNISQKFWQWVVDFQLPIIICEGVKKSACLLSCGYVAIAISGINNGYRVNRNDQGQIINRELIPDLEIFTQKSRPFYICFDYEESARKLKLLNTAIATLGELLHQGDCSVKVIRLPGAEKGVDDFIVSQGETAFEQIYQQSLDLKTDLAIGKNHTELTYHPAKKLNQRYLGNLELPKTGLVGIKSAKNTGKTTALQKLVKTAKSKKQPILLLTHRIQLGKFLSQKININWIGNVPNQQIPSRPKESLTLGICVDSLGKLNINDWKGALIIMDEVEQCLWHLLHSNTCKEKRVKILQIFENLISTVLQTGGLIIAQDADLSDISIDYLQGLSKIENLQPYILVNKWQPQQEKWPITFYESLNPTPLIQQLEQDLLSGKKCYITTDSRAGRYSCETLSKYLRQKLQKLQNKYPKTLIVSSHTTNTVGHCASNFTENINEKSQQYDAVFVTPSLGTGVSIETTHFDRVYGIFQGVIPDWEARQALARVRTNVPRIIWTAKRGLSLIGNGSKNYRILSQWYQENQKDNLSLIRTMGIIDVDSPIVYDPIHLRIWAKMAARVNTSLNHYRQSCLEGLISEGHEVNIISDQSASEQLKKLRFKLIATAKENIPEAKKIMMEIYDFRKQTEKQAESEQNVKEQMRKIHQKQQYKNAEFVANARDISDIEYRYLRAKISLTETERNQLDKYTLKQRYGITVTPELKLKDDRGYYSQILTHYYLMYEYQSLLTQEQQEWSEQIYKSEGKVFLPDLKTYHLKVTALKALQIEQILDINRQYQEDDPDIIHLKENALHCSKHIHRVLGVNIPPDTNSGIKILRLLLAKLGLKLKPLDGGKFKIDLLTFFDERQKIFTAWRSRDMLLEKIPQLTSSIEI
jgi:Domain of unknown function (DUF3854)